MSMKENTNFILKGINHQEIDILQNTFIIFIGLARLIELSVNWSIVNRKRIIDEQNETIDYLLLLFC